MVQNDINYVMKLQQVGLIQSPCLECGIGTEAGYDGSNFKFYLKPFGVKVIGADISAGPQVDVVVDFHDKKEEIQKAFSNYEPFKTIIISNVLEHVFDPIAILDNLLHLLAEEGVIIVIAPCTWPLHQYPIDTWRINPNFYEEYAKRRGLKLDLEHFEYTGIAPVTKTIDAEGNYRYPSPWKTNFQKWRGKIGHRLFKSYAKNMIFESWLSIGAVLQKPKNWRASETR